MGNLCASMSAEDLKAAKMSKEVDQANEAAFKKVGGLEPGFLRV